MAAAARRRVIIGWSLIGTGTVAAVTSVLGWFPW